MDKFYNHKGGCDSLDTRGVCLYKSFYYLRLNFILIVHFLLDNYSSHTHTCTPQASILRLQNVNSYFQCSGLKRQIWQLSAV